MPAHHRITRRRLLAGIAASTVATPALAKPPFARGGRGPAGSRVPLAVTLDFADRQSLSFSESAATDIGDYVGPFVHQKCLRQRASGNGDYRDAFVAFFRPDADFSRDELVIELGSEYNLSTSAAPAPASGVTPTMLFIPPPPTIGKTTGGTSGQSGTAFAYISYVTPDGESFAGTVSSIVLATGELLTVTSPAAAGGATAYNIYASFIGGIGYLQNGSPIPIGTNWTSPNTGLLVSGTQTPTTATSIAYTATISGGNLVSPVVLTVPVHWWPARWRWMSAPRPLVRTAADLVTMKATFPYSATYLYSPALPPAKTWAGPMDTGGLEYGMGNTADRGDIGLTTEWQAAWLLTGNSSMETSWRANAEAVGSMSWWIRDATTSAPFDLFDYPYISWHNGGLAKYGITKPIPKLTAKAFFQLDQSHMPAASFIPWMLTDDPYFLEGAQAEAQYAVMDGNGTAYAEGLPALFSTGQQRAWGWSLRSVGNMADFAPVSPPGWLKDRAYFVEIMNSNKLYAQKYVDSTTPQCAVFGLIPETNLFSVFMIDFIGIATSLLKYRGSFPDWDEIVDYTLIPRLTLADYTGSLGWDGRLPTPYNLPLLSARLGVDATLITGGRYATAPTADTPTSYAELWTVLIPWLADYYGINWSDPSTWMPGHHSGIGSGYSIGARGVLAAAALNGNSLAATEHTWLDNEMKTTLAGFFVGYNQYKWAMSPT